MNKQFENLFNGLLKEANFYANNKLNELKVGHYKGIYNGIDAEKVENNIRFSFSVTVNDLTLIKDFNSNYDASKQLKPLFDIYKQIKGIVINKPTISELQAIAGTEIELVVFNTTKGKAVTFNKKFIQQILNENEVNAANGDTSSNWTPVFTENK